MSRSQALASEKEARETAESARETEWEHPSFVRELFLGRFRLDLIHPHPEQHDPDEAARAADFLAKLRAVMETVDSDEIDREGEIPESVVQRLRDDQVTETDRREAYQSVAPAVEEGLYLVPKVIE